MVDQARARALVKWRNSKKIIGDLIRNPSSGNVRDGKAPWSIATAKWMRASKISMNQSLEELKIDVAEFHRIRRNKRASADINRIAENSWWHMSICAKNKKVYKQAGAVTMHDLLRIKIGAIAWNKNLQNANILPKGLLKCQVCRSREIDEDLVHFLFVCPRLESERKCAGIKEPEPSEGLSNLYFRKKKQLKKTLKFINMAIHIRKYILKGPGKPGPVTIIYNVQNRTQADNGNSFLENLAS